MINTKIVELLRIIAITLISIIIGNLDIKDAIVKGVSL